jgi:AraC-like DNA-binding protein
MDRFLPRSPFCVGVMSAVAAEHGMPLAECLRGTGIDESRVFDPEAEISYGQELAVIANILGELGGVPALALNIGRRFHISGYLLTLALLSCPTLGDAFALASRYDALSLFLTRKRISTVGNDLFCVVVADGTIPESQRAFVVERDVVGTINVLRELFGQLPLRRVCFEAPAPPHARALQDFFGVELNFSSACNLWTLDKACLDVPLPRADPHALRYCEAQLEAMLARRRENAGLIGKVRSILMQDLEHAADMERVASKLCMSSRNLRRLLAEEGVTFRELHDNVRELVAENLLTGARLTLEQVAERLGYDRPTSFTEAFKRWKNVAPSEWRDAHRQLMR